MPFSHEEKAKRKKMRKARTEDELDAAAGPRLDMTPEERKYYDDQHQRIVKAHKTRSGDQWKRGGGTRRRTRRRHR